MTYTHLSLPHERKPRLHALIMGGFVVLSAAYLVGILGATYYSLEKSNAQLTAKLEGFSQANPVSAPIVTPATGDTQQSLIPVDKTEVIDLLNKVNTLALLPSDESPTLATVTDIQKLQKDIFFRNGENGDKLFIYQETGMVLLYRPSEGKVVNMGTINGAAGKVQGVSQKRASAEANLKNVRVAIYYATDNLQKQQSIVKAVSALPNIEIVKQSYTRKDEYEGVSVIALAQTGNGTIFKDILKATGGLELANAPPGEEFSGADIAIVVGK